MALISNPYTVPVKAADMGTSNTTVSITLLTEVANFVKTDREKLNAIRECLQKAGLMS